MVFQNKSVSGNSLRPRRGGPAESHREYYVGEGFLGKTPPLRTEADDPRKVRPHELLSPHGG